MTASSSASMLLLLLPLLQLCYYHIFIFSSGEEGRRDKHNCLNAGSAFDEIITADSILIISLLAIH